MVVGCAQKQEKVAVVVNPPLIIADAVPVVSSSKRSIGVRINFENIAQADYNYARFKLTAYNSVGNSVKPKKGVRDSAYVRLAGPITPGQTKSTIWTNTWANKDVQCINLDEVELIFMDGSIETASGSRLLNNQASQTCI
ncbi:MAG: hypothetical protein ACI9ES_000115 [Oceanospirillaceae bacterium]|jgi:hypothetical protein